MELISTIEECYEKNLPLSIEQDGVHINGKVYPSKTETLFFSDNQPITLDSLIAALIYPKKHIDYHKECIQTHIPVINVLTRTAIINYFVDKKPTPLLRAPESSTSGTPSTNLTSISTPSSAGNASIPPASSTRALRRPFNEWTLEDVYNDEQSCAEKQDQLISSLPSSYPSLKNLPTLLDEAEKVGLVRLSSSNLIGPAKSLSSSKATSLLEAMKGTYTTATPTSSIGSSESDAKKQKTSGSTGTSTISSTTSAPAASLLRRGTPIIIVPSGSSGMIGLNNVESFLCNNRYIPANQCPEPANISRHNPNVLFFKRQSTLKPNTSVEFMVTDAPEKLSDSEMQRVVAVFVSGQQWQMKALQRLGKTPSEIFARAPGFYVFFENDPVHNNVKTWPVVRCELNRTKRHLDSPWVSEFWSTVLKKITQSPLEKLVNY